MGNYKKGDHVKIEVEDKHFGGERMDVDAGGIQRRRAAIGFRTTRQRANYNWRFSEGKRLADRVGKTAEMMRSPDRQINNLEKKSLLHGEYGIA